MPKLIIALMSATLLSACASTSETAASGEPGVEATGERMVRRCESVTDIGSNRPRRVCRMVPAGS
ncbi:hypothetical protein SAMN04488568_102356 [Maricaulis salignorans]|uniref:Uncharacterized protein n=1 Tax=Maricaulis salignorans TaxID=144026 RepID=A0A1G9NJQ5_9PROT|nr:hypothetical protein SAMN04488568_102356 [Maricaulis salignorans]